MKIYVRRRHIKAGKCRAARSCPIALAFEEVVGERPLVDAYSLSTHDKGFALPRSARRFIERFDQDKPVKPFAFFLREA